MDILLPFILFIVGLIIIIKGGDYFVDAAVWIAKITGIPNILIGATIVSLATTLPELFVSSIATANGAPDMALGNAVGSTICNIGLILAISLIFMPGKINRKSFAPKAILMVVSTIILLFFSFDGVLVKSEGVVLFLLLAVYVALNIKEAKSSSRDVAEEVAIEMEVKAKGTIDSKEITVNSAKFIFGTAFIVIGANLLVNNGQTIARFFNIPEQIISLTLIALGTSLPELVTAISSIIKKEHGISIGNILGANILNVTMILGACSFISPDGLTLSSRDIAVFGRTFSDVPQTLNIDIPVTLALMSLVLLPGLLRGRFKKINGILLLCVYISYIAFLGSMLI